MVLPANVSPGENREPTGRYAPRLNDEAGAQTCASTEVSTGCPQVAKRPFANATPDRRFRDVPGAGAIVGVATTSQVVPSCDRSIVGVDSPPASPRASTNHSLPNATWHGPRPFAGSGMRRQVA